MRQGQGKPESAIRMAHPINDHADSAVWDLQRHVEGRVLEPVADCAGGKPAQVKLTNQTLHETAASGTQVPFGAESGDVQPGVGRQWGVARGGSWQQVLIHLQNQVMVQVPRSCNLCERNDPHRSSLGHIAR